MPPLPSLQLVAEEVAGELAAQERRGDALDSKAGIVLGFAGVIVGLTVQNVRTDLGEAGLAAAALAALAAGAAFLPRSFPTIGVLALRQGYLERGRRRARSCRDSDRARGYPGVKEMAMSESAATVVPPPQGESAPPPLEPDPELIDHLEGNPRSRRGYRQEAKKLRMQPQR